MPRLPGIRKILFVTILATAVLTLVLADGLRITGTAAQTMPKGEDLMTEQPDGYPTALFAGGCFWCLESEFRGLEGVLFTRAGYTGGALKNPGYRDITTGETDHAEAVEITFDPVKTSYRDLVEFFLTKAHDPTQLNRQGVDVGPQYRSEIFFQDDTQKEEAEQLLKTVSESGIHKKPIVTKLSPAVTFWEAEEYHQQYYEKYEEENGEPHIRVLLKKGKKW